MKELDIKSSNELIDIYEKYFYDGLTGDVQRQAKKAYDEDHPAGTILNEKINLAVGKLFPLAYPDSGSGMKLPSKKETRQLITELEKFRIGLDNT